MRAGLEIVVPLCPLGSLPGLGTAHAESVARDASLYQWQVEDFAIIEPLRGLTGEPLRGRVLAADRHGGHGLARHPTPGAEEAVHGTIGPPRYGTGHRREIHSGVSRSPPKDSRPKRQRSGSH